MRYGTLPHQRCPIGQLRSDDGRLIRIDHRNDLHILVHPGYRFEEKDGAGQATEEIPCPGEKAIAEGKVAERETLMRSAKAEGLEMHQESCNQRDQFSPSPLMHSFLSSPMPTQSALWPSTISIHRSLTTFSGASAGKRYAMKLYIAKHSVSSLVVGLSGSGMRRISREPMISEITYGSLRMSPIDGPPKHLRISADDPPSSDTGRTKAGEDLKAEEMALAPVPPEMIR